MTPQWHCCKYNLSKLVTFLFDGAKEFSSTAELPKPHFRFSQWHR